MSETQPRTCDSCRLDWQIQQGTRYLLDPQIETSALADLDERIIARATAIMHHSEQLPGWGHLAGSGLLVTLAAVAVAWAPVNAGVMVPVTHVGLTHWWELWRRYCISGGLTRRSVPADMTSATRRLWT